MGRPVRFLAGVLFAALSGAGLAAASRGAAHRHHPAYDTVRTRIDLGAAVDRAERYAHAKAFAARLVQRHGHPMFDIRLIAGDRPETIAVDGDTGTIVTGNRPHPSPTLAPLAIPSRSKRG
jgi:hypothetical protein